MWKLQSSVPSVCVEASYQSRLDDVFFFYCYLKWRLFFNKKCQMNWIWSASRQNIVVVSKNQFNLKGIKRVQRNIEYFLSFLWQCGYPVLKQELRLHPQLPQWLIPFNHLFTIHELVLEHIHRCIHEAKEFKGTFYQFEHDSSGHGYRIINLT